MVDLCAQKCSVLKNKTQCPIKPSSLDPVAQECDICLTENDKSVGCSFCTANVCRQCLFDWWNASNKSMLYKCCTCKQRGFFRIEEDYNSIFLFEDTYVPVRHPNSRLHRLIFCMVSIVTIGFILVMSWLIYCKPTSTIVTSVVGIITVLSIYICLCYGCSRVSNR